MIFCMIFRENRIFEPIEKLFGTYIVHHKGHVAKCNAPFFIFVPWGHRYCPNGAISPSGKLDHFARSIRKL